MTRYQKRHLRVVAIVLIAFGIFLWIAQRNYLKTRNLNPTANTNSDDALWWILFF